MGRMPDELYESFKSNLEKVDGKCFRASKDTLAETLTGLFKKLDIKDTCIAETPLLKEAGVAEALKNAGIEVFTDHIRLHAETAKGGISENQYGIAELGTMGGSWGTSGVSPGESVLVSSRGMHVCFPPEL